MHVFFRRPSALESQKNKALHNTSKIQNDTAQMVLTTFSKKLYKLKIEISLCTVSSFKQFNTKKREKHCNLNTSSRI